MIAKKPHPNAPSFVIANISVKVEDFAPFMEENAKGGWLNIGIKEAKSGKFYAELDTWEKGQKSNELKPDGGEEIGADDIPY